MSQQENRISDSHHSKWIESSKPLDDDLEIARLSAARAQAMDEAGATIARQLNGPLTALLLYMGEIKQHSHAFSQSAGDRVYLQQVVENALQQTERVCAMMKQLADAYEGTAVAPGRKGNWKTRAGQAMGGIGAPAGMF
jgi:signal transduction histidine kinase